MRRHRHRARRKYPPEPPTEVYQNAYQQWLYGVPAVERINHPMPLHPACIRLSEYLTPAQSSTYAEKGALLWRDWAESYRRLCLQGGGGVTW